MIRGRDGVTAGAAAGLLLVLVCAVAGPSVVPHGALASDAGAVLLPPSGAHPFGTDRLGRDVLARVVGAARLDLGIALGSAALALALGGAAGVAAGLLGGWTDRVLGRAADAATAFPLFVLATGIAAALGGSAGTVVLATAVVNVPAFMRLARADTLGRRGAGFVQAARLAGNGEMRVLLFSVLPNVLPGLVVQASLVTGYAAVNAAGLGFLGLGVRPPAPEWGSMVAEGAALAVSGAWWVALFPGLALVGTATCFNLLGDGLRDRLDPRDRG